MAISTIPKPLESIIYANEALTVDYVQNSYVSSNDLGITVRRKGLVYCIDCNLWLSTNIPQSAGSVNIAKIKNYAAAKTIRAQIPNGNYTLNLTIDDSTGNVTIASITSSVASGWYRFHAVEAVWNL